MWNYVIVYFIYELYEYYQYYTNLYFDKYFIAIFSGFLSWRWQIIYQTKQHFLTSMPSSNYYMAQMVHARDTTEMVHARDTTEMVHARDTTEMVHARNTTEMVCARSFPDHSTVWGRYITSTCQ